MTLICMLRSSERFPSRYQIALSDKTLRYRVTWIFWIVFWGRMDELGAWLFRKTTSTWDHKSCERIQEHIAWPTGQSHGCLFQKHSLTSSLRHFSNLKIYCEAAFWNILCDVTEIEKSSSTSMKVTWEMYIWLISVNRGNILHLPAKFHLGSGALEVWNKTIMEHKLACINKKISK